MVWQWLNPGQLVATTIEPVINLFIQSIHTLINAFAGWTPGAWFMMVFQMMGGFVTTTGANIRTVVIDLWTQSALCRKRLERLLVWFATSGMQCSQSGLLGSATKLRS